MSDAQDDLWWKRKQRRDMVRLAVLVASIALGLLWAFSQPPNGDNVVYDVFGKIVVGLFVGIFVGGALVGLFLSGWVGTGLVLAMFGVLVSIYLDWDCRFGVELCPGLYFGLGVAAVASRVDGGRIIYTQLFKGGTGLTGRMRTSVVVFDK